MNDEVISYSAEEKQKAGLPSFIGLVDSALKEAKTMLEGDEQVYFAVELATHFLAAGNAVVSTVDIKVDEAAKDAVDVTA